MNDLTGTGKAILGILLEQSDQDLDDVLRFALQIRTHLLAPVPPSSTLRGSIGGNKGETSSQDLMKSDSKGVEVRTAIWSATFNDLRSDIMESALDGEIKSTGDFFGKTKVNQFHSRGAETTIGRSRMILDLNHLRSVHFTDLSRPSDQDIVRFDVKVDIALNMDVLQRSADLHDHIEKLLLLEGGARSQQIISTDELTDDEPVMAIGDATEVVNASQVWMTKPGQCLVLDLGPLLGIFQVVRTQHLEGNLATDLENVLTEEDGTHRPGTQLTDDPVPAVDTFTRGERTHDDPGNGAPGHHQRHLPFLMKNTTKSQIGPPLSTGSTEGVQSGHLAASLDRPETASMGPYGADEPSANLPERVFLIQFSA